MMRLFRWLLVLLLFCLLIISGCVKRNKAADTNSDVSTVMTNNQGLRRDLQKKLPHTVDLISDRPAIGSINVDLNGDGKMDKLEYVTIVTIRPDRSLISECRINIGGVKVSQRSEEGISCLGIADIDQRDHYVEFYLSDGELRGGTPVVYRYNGSKIIKIATLDGGIEAVSGDGKVYYWGGNLYEAEGKPFDPRLVLSYYDITKKKYIETNQIVGRTITADRDVLVYKDAQDVPEGPPVEVDAKALQRDGKLVKILEKGDRFKVLSLQAGTRVKLPDGREGWIGGFRMVWD